MAVRGFHIVLYYLTLLRHTDPDLDNTINEVNYIDYNIVSSSVMTPVVVVAV